MIIEQIQRELRLRKETLAVAESCTGGYIASKITGIPGASVFFLGGVIVYSNAMKQKLLGVPEMLIQKYGAVSQEVVEAMAEGLIRLTNCDWVVSVSGIAGPNGGTKEKPVGTVYGALGKRGEMESGLIPLTPHQVRQANIEKSAEWLLEALLRKVRNERAF